MSKDVWNYYFIDVMSATMPQLIPFYTFDSYVYFKNNMHLCNTSIHQTIILYKHQHFFSGPIPFYRPCASSRTNCFHNHQSRESCMTSSTPLSIYIVVLTLCDVLALPHLRFGWTFTCIVLVTRLLKGSGAR